jgi:RNA polymerase sigma-70 factor (ECF subfamily)
VTFSCFLAIESLQAGRPKEYQVDETSTDDLLAIAVEKDIEAFVILYRRHLHRVYSYLLSRVTNVQDAQDLTSQTFTAALKSIKTYTPQDTFGAWLIGIARHKTLDHFRKQSPVVPLETVASVSDPSPIVDELVDERLQMQEIVALLERIGADRAEVVRLRFFGELKIHEIARLTGKSEGAIKMLLARALDDIRKLLSVEEGTR